MSQDSNFTSGAVRCADADALDFISISPIALIALARTCAEGARKYGRHNWELGMPAHDMLNHAFGHLVMYLAGDRSQPHLPHALWGIAHAIHSEVLWPELNEPHMRGPGCRITSAMKKFLRDGKEERDAKRRAGEFDGLDQWDVRDIAQVVTILAQQHQSGQESEFPTLDDVPSVRADAPAEDSPFFASLKDHP
jgi:hypothetical protein